MKSNSRTFNVVKNIKFGVISQVLTLFLSFASRTIFIRVLGKEYLGINGLFTNILTILSFAELGIGNAIIYSMYKPLSENNHNKIKALMDLYAKAYKIIALIITILGLLIIPFLDIIIKDIPNIKENINIIYMIFLLNTVTSYLFSYKKSIIIADQQNYKVIMYQQVFYIGQVLVQMITLFILENYLVFMIIQVLSNLLNNIVVSQKCDKMYPYLKSKEKYLIDKEEKNEIFRNVKSLFLYKFGSVILNGTDNIIISAYIGVGLVGISSNYLMIITAISGILGQAMTAFTASIGNLNAIESSDKKENIFNQLFLLSGWIYGVCSVCLIVCLNSFVYMWVGDNYMLSLDVVISLVLNFYVNGIQFAAFTYRNTMGLFTKGRYLPIIAAIINIVLSIVLAKYIGLVGVFIATIISRIVTMGWFDPLMVYKIGFNKKPWKYYCKYIIHAFIVIISVVVSNTIINYIVVDGFMLLLLKAMISFIVANIIFIIIFCNTNEFKALKLRGLTFLKVIK